MEYFNLEDIENQTIPDKEGYQAKLIQDRINNIGFYILVETEAHKEIARLKQNLADTDYKAIKYAEGFLTEEEYEPIKTERQAWRIRINELEAGE